MRFSVQEHFAKRYHFDLRLEMDGIAKSWAIPKGFPEKGEKRLAIQVEDHSLEYMEFDGIIEEGYGKGVVRLWDVGDYELLKKTEKEIKFKLNGKKLKGVYVLIKFGKTNENSWLLMKLSDL